MKSYWLSPGVTTLVDISVGEQIQTIPVNWAENMVGAIPVFETKEAALAYNPKVEPLELRVASIE